MGLQGVSAYRIGGYTSIMTQLYTPSFLDTKEKDYVDCDKKELGRVRSVALAAMLNPRQENEKDHPSEMLTAKC